MRATNLYPQEARSGVQPSDVEVFIAGHRGPDPSKPDELCSQSSNECLVRCQHFWYSLHCFSISNLHGFLVCFYCRRDMARQWSSAMEQIMTGNVTLLILWPCMRVEEEKAMDGEKIIHILWRCNMNVLLEITMLFCFVGTQCSME